ncbi:MAG: hypothetical protein HQL40_04865 [Alphaproteobacteria bacterium]|nr:hypothetical protein [Alphaproteobacteria bacterium]
MIGAPYNFVPLSETVVLPQDADTVSHDKPFSDGLSGRLRLTLTTFTPLLVGGAHDDADDPSRPTTVRFFRVPGKEPSLAIPGTTVKGAVRNVLEIASFGKMAAVDDNIFGLRDLTGTSRRDYNDKVSLIHPDGSFEPRARAGWLRFDDQAKAWKITECHQARVEHADIDTLGRLRYPRGESFAGRWVQNRWKGRTASEKYALWAQSLEVTVQVHAPAVHVLTNRTRKGLRTTNVRFAKADKLAFATGPVPAGHATGRLVFTGQPNEHKQMDFLFHGATGASFVVDETVARGFLRIHEDSEEWAFWNARRKKGIDVPVFFLAERGRAGKDEVRSFGLALMFKMAYANSVHGMLRHTSDLHRDERAWDLAELMFGRVGKNTRGLAQGTGELFPISGGTACRPVGRRSHRSGRSEAQLLSQLHPAMGVGRRAAPVDAEARLPQLHGRRGATARLETVSGAHRVSNSGSARTVETEGSGEA